jgi:DNA-directed RNA polymerase specialized sigma24 family protein
LAVLLRFQQGYSYEVMADLARERAGTLRQRVVRTLCALRVCIERRTAT